MDLYAQRHDTYMDLASYVLSTHGKTPRQAAQTVIDMLNEHVIHVSGAQPEYDVTTNEIGKENGPSLFEVISSRYLKSGYSKLLEEEPTKK